MKHLITCLVLGIAFAAGAQGTTIQEYPWNPDWNNDNFVGSSDLTGFLSAFGSEFGNPPEPCDYDGSDFEQLMFGVYEGTIILDSIFVEYQLQDSQTYFLVGCPDPITDTVVVSNSVMLESFTFASNNTYWRSHGYDYQGNYHSFQFEWNTLDGHYKIVLYNDLVHNSGYNSDGFFGSNQSTTPEVPLPLPSNWYLNADGIHFDNVWETWHWAYYANYLHILPYWHYAE